MTFIPAHSPPLPSDFPVMIHCEEVPALGLEAASIRAALEAMRAHLSVPVYDAVDAGEAELEDYEHVPFRSIGAVRVRYREGGTLKPRSVWSEGGND